MSAPEYALRSESVRLAARTIEAQWLNHPTQHLADQAAQALEDACLLQSPETAAEFEKLVRWHREDAKENERLRARVAELEAERHSTNDALAEVTEAHRAVSAPADVTVWRAQHDSIPMGLYTSREAAQAHCEASVRQEEPAESIRHLSWWTDPEGDHDEYELHITPSETGGLIHSTGYYVTPLTVAAAYDAEADE